MGNTAEFPFTAIIGCEAAKRALLLLAVEPALKGVLIGAGPGSAKSTLARAFAIFAGDSVGLTTIPANVAVEDLVGGLDVERTLAAGERVFALGLLARATGGMLFVEDLNLLDASVVSVIASALDSGEASLTTQLGLIGAYNPAEGLPAPVLLNRVGLLVEAARIDSTDDRAEIITRSIQFENDPRGFARHHEIADSELTSRVENAREALSNVAITGEQIRDLARASLALGIVGNVTDLFAVKAARANAALSGRGRVEEEDLILAIQLVLMPRARALPQVAQDAAAGESVTPEQSSEHNSTDSTEDERQSTGGVAPVVDLVIKAIDASPPDLLVNRMLAAQTEAKHGKRGSPLTSDRGRAVTGGMKRGRQSRVALYQTLCAAAPFQTLRRKGREPITIKKSDIRYKRFKGSSGILFIFAVDASGSMALNRMAQAKGALGRVLQKAYLNRDKVALISFRGETAHLLLPPTRSIERAKGLIDSLPAGGGTPVAAALIRALDLAKFARVRKMAQVMVVLMTDGRANIPSRLSVGVDRASQDEINQELRQIGRAMRSEAIESVVIDTRPKFVSSGEARKLADMLGGKYLYLPRTSSTGIHEAIESVASAMREKHILK